MAQVINEIRNPERFAVNRSTITRLRSVVETTRDFLGSDLYFDILVKRSSVKKPGDASLTAWGVLKQKLSAKQDDMTADFEHLGDIGVHPSAKGTKVDMHDGEPYSESELREIASMVDVTDLQNQEELLLYHRFLPCANNIIRDSLKSIGLSNIYQFDPLLQEGLIGSLKKALNINDVSVKWDAEKVETFQDYALSYFAFGGTGNQKVDEIFEPLLDSEGFSVANRATLDLPTVLLNEIEINLGMKHRGEVELNATKNRSHFAERIDADLRDAGINEPLFPTPQLKTLFEKTGSPISWLISEGAVSMEQQRPELEARHRAMRLSTLLASNLYFEGGSSESSDLAKSIRALTDHNIPDYFPRPVKQLVNSPSEIYRTDRVPISHDQVVKSMSVEDDYFPGGIGLGTAMHHATETLGMIPDFVSMMKNAPVSPEMIENGFNPKHFTIFRPKEIFPRPEHKLIAHYLEQYGYDVSIVNIEDIKNKSEIPPGFVFTYATPGGLYKSPEILTFDLLTQPRKLNQIFSLGWDEAKLASLDMKMQDEVSKGITGFRRFLTSFIDVGNAEFKKTYYKELFEAGNSEFAEKFDAYVRSTSQERNKLLDSINNRHENDLYIFNNPNTMRIIGTKIMYALMFVPGFKEELIRQGELTGQVSVEDVEVLYNDIPETFPIMQGNTGVASLDAWLNEKLQQFRTKPGVYVAKLSADSGGRLDWGSRSIISGAGYKDGEKWLSVCDKLVDSDLPWLAQGLIAPTPSTIRPDTNQMDVIPLDGLQIGHYDHDGRLTSWPSILRVSPYMLGDKVSQGIVTGEAYNGGDFATSHGGTDSFMGPLVI